MTDSMLTYIIQNLKQHIPVQYYLDFNIMIITTNRLTQTQTHIHVESDPSNFITLNKSYFV